MTASSVCDSSAGPGTSKSLQIRSTAGRYPSTNAFSLRRSDSSARQSARSQVEIDIATATRLHANVK